jgi:uncharacterized protein (UPF0548 family)
VLAEARAASPTYAEIGATASASLPSGYHHLRRERVLGSGDDVFSRAAAGLRTWELQRRCGMSVLADADVQEGATVVIAAPLPLGFTIVTCRVVDVAEESDSYAFTYGTLPLHAEQGEERFEVTRDSDRVVFRVVAFSRPQQLLVRAAGPVARALQRRATDHYLDAMQSIASETH